METLYYNLHHFNTLVSKTFYPLKMSIGHAFAHLSYLSLYQVRYQHIKLIFGIV
ncbi:hypothetical protein J2S14_002607 [Lederbergia wuyishanensis]|uniref:Uncharacterized protein n=1 Tax=Lederbergia wuyishanensis TaxID=1347903 RepID=A0ABU0D5T4_9BACI|nr:hypothetical protein [Lederbergia wuyishanensis]